MLRKSTQYDTRVILKNKKKMRGQSAKVLTRQFIHEVNNSVDPPSRLIISLYHHA